MTILFYAMVFLGALLMINNIIRYYRFTKKMLWLMNSKRDRVILYLPHVPQYPHAYERDHRLHTACPPGEHFRGRDALLSGQD